MRRNALQAHGFRVILEQLPNDLLAQRLAAHVVSAIHRSEKPAGNHACLAYQTSIATLTHVGIGTVRTRPCFPTRSTMHQRPSRCWTWAIVSAATSERRSPQPRSNDRIARSRNPFLVKAAGALSSACACRSVSQLPSRIPFDATPLIRLIPEAISGARSPLSAASTANLRTAVIRTLIDTAPRDRKSVV